MRARVALAALLALCAITLQCGRYGPPRRERAAPVKVAPKQTEPEQAPDPNSSQNSDDEDESEKKTP